MGGPKMYRYERRMICTEVGVLWATDLEEAMEFVAEGEGLWPEGVEDMEPLSPHHVGALFKVSCDDSDEEL